MTSLKCKNCGADIQANVKFCGTCGTPADQSQTPETAIVTNATAQDTNSSGGAHVKAKKFLIPAIAIGVIIIAAIILLNIFKTSKYEIPKGELYIMQVGDSVVIEQNGKSKAKLEGQIVRTMYNIDNTKAAVLINENDTNEEEAYSLYFISDKPTLVTDGVYNIRLSLNGKGIAFTRDYNPSTHYAKLCLWSEGKISTITADYRTYYGYNISPDGKNVTYLLYDEDKGKTKGYYYNGKPIELGNGINPVAIADGAKYIYYNKDESFYVQKGTDEDSRIKLGENVKDYYFNKDLSQIVYRNKDRSYISRNGGEKDSLSGSVQRFLTPNGMKYQDSIICITSFADMFYIDDRSAIVRINGKFEADSIARNVSGAYIANDGKTITFTKGNSIYQIDGLKENAEEVELVKGDVVNFISTDDGGAVYFLNSDDELCYQIGKDKPVVVGEDLGGSNLISDYWSMFKGKNLLFVSNDELFWSAGKRGKAVKGIDGDFRYVVSGPLSVLVSTSDDGETLIYRSTDGNKFELIYRY